ncbi:MAG: NlpC/P60 family protein [Pseudomonadota bacterium]
MSDPRLTPNPARVTMALLARANRPVVNLYRRPDGPRDRQVLYGEVVTVLGEEMEWSYVQARKDGYCGYVPSNQLAVYSEATHDVYAPATHIYEDADFKSPNLVGLSFGSRLTCTRNVGRFSETELGFVPSVHIKPLSENLSDPAAVATAFLGTPYLWGGNSRWGIDCSGLVQAALMACGIPCPGDSDMQETLGANTNGAYQRNDLLFWKGHVALVSGPDTVIHANAHAMATVYENVHSAIKRIEDQGDGPVIAHRRL